MPCIPTLFISNFTHLLGVYSPQMQSCIKTGLGQGDEAVASNWWTTGIRPASLRHFVEELPAKIGSGV